MPWKITKEYISILIQTNLAYSYSNIWMILIQTAIYYCQLAYFLIGIDNEQVFELIKGISKISLLIPLYENSQINGIVIGILLLVLNMCPYLIILYRLLTKFMKNIDNISRSLLQLQTTFINTYFLYFTWILFIPQIYFTLWNLAHQLNIFIMILSSFNLILSITTLIIANTYFINLEFNERSLKKHFFYSNLFSQILIIIFVFLFILGSDFKILLSRILHGLMLLIQLYEAFAKIPYGYLYILANRFSTYGNIYNHCLITHVTVYLSTLLYISNIIKKYEQLTVYLLLLVFLQMIVEALFERKRDFLYINIKHATQYFELHYIENFFNLGLQSQTNHKKKLELLIKFGMHKEQCIQVLCQCKRLNLTKIYKIDVIVGFLSCLFKSSFTRSNYANRLFDFEIISLKFLTFINRYKRNGPKTYQELKILFQHKRPYSFFFTTMCQLLQCILQSQMHKDEDYNINTEHQTRISNVKLQKATRNDRSIVQNLYQMEQAKSHMLPLLIQISQFKSNFWKGYYSGKINSYPDLEKQLLELLRLKNSITRIHEKYRKVFEIHGKSYNVQFLKFSAIMHLVLFNDAKTYDEIEKQCKEIQIYEKSMNTYEITNINFFKGSAISVKLAIAMGPNIGTIRNKVLSPSIPKFFGFENFNNPMIAFLDFTKGNINTLMPDWISPIHDEVMQNYIRRGFTQRIGKYFQTFIKLYDKSLCRVQVYLAHNFGPDLEADFTMIGCVKRLDEEQVEHENEHIELHKRTKKKRQYFKGSQYILFDIYGNILGITSGAYQMIERFQRQIEFKTGIQESLKKSEPTVRRMSSQISTPPSSEEHNAFDTPWSDTELTIETFYEQCLIWMILPFISKEIESAGMQFLMNGQKPKKSEYPNAVDLDISNTVVSNKESFMFIPEDISLFVKQHNKVLVKVYEDDKNQTKNYSQHSSKHKHNSDQQISGESGEYDFQTIKKNTTVFNEKICLIFYEEHMRQNQIFMFNPDRQSVAQNLHLKNGAPQSRTSLYNTDEDLSENDEDNPDDLYYDKLEGYIKKISIQDFNPIPIVYSINYEEYQYKKNDIDNKVQMFVLELQLNEQQILNTDINYRKYLRETLKLTIQSQRKKLDKQFTDQGQLSLVDSINERVNSEKDQEVGNYKFKAHPSNYFLNEQPFIQQYQNDFSEQMNSPIEPHHSLQKNSIVILTKRSENEDLLERKTKHTKTQVQDVQTITGSYGKLKFKEKQIVQKLLIKQQQKKHQQEFYARDDSNHQASKEGDNIIKDDNKSSQQDVLQQFHTKFKSLNKKILNYKYPNFYNFQVYILIVSVILIVSYIALVSIIVLQQYQYNDCLGLIDVMLAIQSTYSQITHGLFRLQFSAQLNITLTDDFHSFYDKLINTTINTFISQQSQQDNLLNLLNIKMNNVYDIDISDEIIQQPDLGQFLRQVSAYYYQIQHDNLVTDSHLLVKQIEGFTANLQEISRLPQAAYDLCYQDKLGLEQQYQDILLSYMIIIFFLVTVIQIAQFPLITKLIKYQKSILRFVLAINVDQVRQEIDSYEYFEKQLKVSIYEWMAINFLIQGKLLLENTHDRQTTFGSLLQTEQSQSVNFANKNKKQFKKINLSNFRQIKYILILILGLIVIMVYFLIIFLVIFMYSGQIQSLADDLFNQKHLQSNFVNFLTNFDIQAYNSVGSFTPFLNSLNTSQFLFYSTQVTTSENDIYYQYQNNLMTILQSDSINQQIKIINEQNICSSQAADCINTILYKQNSSIIQEFEYGLKYLLIQLEKVVKQYPIFFQENDNNQSEADFIEFVTSHDHLINIDYGNEILIKAFDKLIDLQVEQFDHSLFNYRQALLIFIFCVGTFGLLIQGLLGRFSLNQQKKQLEICKASLYLLSPRRYQEKAIDILKKKL